jgi:subtilisin family serine protease
MQVLGGADPVSRDIQPGAFVPGSVVVRLRSGAGSSATDEVVASSGYAVEDTIAPLHLLRMRVPPGQEMSAVARLQTLPDVAWAQVDGVSQAMFVPNDGLYRPSQWNLRQIGMEAAWDYTRGDSRVVVAVLDTGVDPSHPELAGALVDGYDFLNDDPNPLDDSSHGTHTAGVIAARGNNTQGVAGIAWEARVMPIKVLNNRGLGPESVMIKGLIHAVDNGARIVNLSSGTTRGSPAMEEAVAYAHAKGALLISAAGNTGDKDNAVIYPAAYPEVLAVGATDRNNAVPAFSQRQGYVGVVAPGVDIPSTAWEGGGIGRFALATGTSSAAPHVAGLAALLWSLKPDLTSTQVRELITTYAEDLGPPGRDEVSGLGLINAARSIAALGPRPALPAATPTPPAAVVPGAPPAPTPPPLPTLAPLPTPAPIPRAPSDWYFSEGSTKAPFDTWLHILNPNSERAEAQILLQLVDGQVHEHRVGVAPRSRIGVPLNQVVPNADFSIRIHSDTTVFAERSMFFGHDGHTTAGAAAPSTTWYLAEGSSTPPFDTWILLQNPNARPANIRLNFYGGDGQRHELLQLLPPNSRRNVYVNLVFPSSGFSTTIAADAPIVAERAMYFDGGQAGHGALAARTPARTWYLAEGATRPGFETWLVLYNPGDLPTQVQVSYLREEGEPVRTTLTLPARGRARISAANHVGEQTFGAVVESIAPIVAERVMFFGEDVRGAHASTGVHLASQEWFLPEGSTKPPFREYVAVLNPNAAPADLEVSLLPAGGGEPRALPLRVRAEGRLTIDLNHLAPDSEMSVRVRANRPIAVERSLYFADGSGGTNAPGIPR